jgi:hypothetical protein
MTERLADRLVAAAQEHAANAGEADFLPGDMALLLTAALRVMSPSVRRQFWRQPELADLADLPEFRLLVNKRRDV